jgi:hypothetical protein
MQQFPPAPIPHRAARSVEPTTSVQDQGRRLHQRQDGPHVDLRHGPQERLRGLGLTLARCHLANQRRKRASPARLARI